VQVALLVSHVCAARARLSYGAISATLKAEELPTRTGVQWRAGTVRRIVRRATGS